jgi:Zn-dependent peptidase ImmA (M78 family)
MKFKINNREWEIIEVDEQVIIDKLQKQEEYKILFANGLTDFQYLKIYLNVNLPVDQKRQTLLHELMHCYIRTFIHLPQIEEASEEVICDISANSHDIIHEIANNYFK